MQHGTGREYVRDIVENVLAVLERYEKAWPTGDLRANLRSALEALESDADLDEPGRFGPDHCPLAKYGRAGRTDYSAGVGVSGVSDTTVGRIDVEEPDDWSDTVLGHAYDEVDEDLSYWDMADERPFGEQQEQVDWLESRFDTPEEYDDPYDYDDGRWDDDPNPYHGTYSEE